MKTKTHPDTIYNLTVYDARKTVHLYDGSRSFKYKNTNTTNCFIAVSNLTGVLKKRFGRVKYPYYQKYFKNAYIKDLIKYGQLKPDAFIAFPTKDVLDSDGYAFLWNTNNMKNILISKIIREIEDDLKYEWFKEEEAQIVKKLGFDFDE